MKRDPATLQGISARHLKTIVALLLVGGNLGCGTQRPAPQVMRWAAYLPKDERPEPLTGSGRISTEGMLKAKNGVNVPHVLILLDVKQPHELLRRNWDREKVRAEDFWLRGPNTETEGFNRRALYLVTLAKEDRTITKARMALVAAEEDASAGVLELMFRGEPILRLAKETQVTNKDDMILLWSF